VVSESERVTMQEVIRNYMVNSADNDTYINVLVEAVKRYPKEEQEDAKQDMYGIAAAEIRQYLIDSKYEGKDPENIPPSAQRNAIKKNLSSLAAYHVNKFKGEIEAAMQGGHVS
jgi:hypothetical protein